MNDQFNLERFVSAQESVYETVCTELRNGLKESHWMWFIFPQWAGLGRTSTARKYAISSLAEACAYIKHPTLGGRLYECTQLVLEIESHSIKEIFEFPDNLKFRSSMTLFAHATRENLVFVQALRRYFNGEYDPLTIQNLVTIHPTDG